MKGRNTKNISAKPSPGKTNLDRLRKMRDEDIDFSDIPKLDAKFWKNARLVMPEPKDRLTIRIDHDVVKWLRKQGPGYQTRINAILRSYMEAHPASRR